MCYLDTSNKLSKVFKKLQINSKKGKPIKLYNNYDVNSNLTNQILSKSFLFRYSK